MRTRTALIAGNWKMNGSKDETAALSGALALKYIQFKGMEKKPFEMLICPPFPYIAMAADIVGDSGLALGGQDVSTFDNGAHTGDVSADMLKDIGATYVIVGHSERRADHHETNEIVRDKSEKAISKGLKVIICIGETEAEKDAGKTLEIIKGQLSESLPSQANHINTVIAYEPIWAIGTGRTPNVQDVEQVHLLIRNVLSDKLGLDEAEKLRILYGGSVKPSNAEKLMNATNVDGALVGGASLKADDFWAIAEAVKG